MILIRKVRDRERLSGRWREFDDSCLPAAGESVRAAERGVGGALQRLTGACRGSLVVVVIAQRGVPVPEVNVFVFGLLLLGC